MLFFYYQQLKFITKTHQSKIYHITKTHHFFYNLLIINILKIKLKMLSKC